MKQKVGKREEIIGVETEATVIKNRIGPPFKKARFQILFESGIDDYGSWLNLLKDYEVVKQAGAWYTLVDETTGEEVKFQAKDWHEKVISNDNLRMYCYNKMCEHAISHYVDRTSVEVDEEDKEGLDE